jgi:archaellum biogenesis protein FlaJ (TadC family)
VEWWRWVAAGVELVVLVLLVLLWFDSFRERPGWSTARAARSAALSAVSIPIGVVAVIVLPVWGVALVIAVPLIALATMALAS